MAIYIKENGTEIEVNDTSASFAESLGWKLKKAPAKKKAKKEVEED